MKTVFTSINNSLYKDNVRLNQELETRDVKSNGEEPSEFPNVALGKTTPGPRKSKAARKAQAQSDIYKN